ncbi:MAG TPA: ADP-forming succinate--CoA ligase subunit beta [Acidobacteriota bacterium]|nr:ADP-forming succinate--CoA ligase subunit beta [Acidobacteriota bacterium]
MKIHEFQAKAILAEYGVKVPEGKLARNPAEAFEIARSFGGVVAVKAQVHAGGRGKGGGIKIARTPQEAEEYAQELIGKRLVTPQTGAEGTEVRFVWVEKGLKIRREFYLGMILDRSSRRPVLMASSEGGVEIEEVAARNPEAILKERIDPTVGLQAFQGRKIAFQLGLDPRRTGSMMASLYRAFIEKDASLVEINPLVETEDGEILALDAKMTFDDNALYRHPHIREMRDFAEEEALEVKASRYGLSYIKLDGNVGCMVNGAGLAMATMDIIKLAGGNPANFLDVGGGANVEQVKNAFKILVSDPNVKAVLINIFGGIMRCDTVAEGVVLAFREAGVQLPVVVRLEGTNVEQGRTILSEAKLNFQVADGMADAAEKVVAAAS